MAPSISSWLFWLAAGALASLCAVLILWFAAKAARGAAPGAAAGAENPARTLYRRQIDELDSLSDQGLLADPERLAARAEAARRLLAEPAATPEKAGSRQWALIAAGAGALGALGLYIWQGSPGMADQSYQERLAEWRSAPLATLRPDEVAAVLRERLATSPNDPRLLAALAYVERAAGDPLSAARYLERASRLVPDNADLQAALGDALAAASPDKPSPEAEATLKRALAMDPKNQSALFHLGQLRGAAGDTAGAAGLWRQLLDQLSPTDRRRAALSALIAKVEHPQATPAPAPDVSGQADFIKGMVASLQARLDAQPDDPQGWVRLVRSYKVLGDGKALAKALAQARALFARRPSDLGPIEAAAR